MKRFYEKLIDLMGDFLFLLLLRKFSWDWTLCPLDSGNRFVIIVDVVGGVVVAAAAAVDVVAVSVAVVILAHVGSMLLLLLLLLLQQLPLRYIVVAVPLPPTPSVITTAFVLSSH